MGVVTVRHRGNFNRLERFLKGASKHKLITVLERYGQAGVRALASATPIDSGKTASSWSYRISISGSSFFIIWQNSHVTRNGTPVAILLQYGHGTRGGGYVQGREFINSAIRPIMDKIAEEVWQEVKNL